MYIYTCSMERREDRRTLAVPSRQEGVMEAQVGSHPLSPLFCTG
jgi:hypothetical protein